MKTPTPFQIAHLAAILKLSADNESKDDRLLVNSARNLYECARKAVELKDIQFAKIESDIFKMSEPEWKQCIQEYSGDLDDINELLKRKLPRADALKKLFPAHTETDATRELKLKGLGSSDYFSQPFWSGSMCRSIAEAKHRQLSKTRSAAAQKKKPSTKSLQKISLKKAA
jgi:hypothetical protein